MQKTNESINGDYEQRMNSMMKTVMIVREGLCLGAQQITQKERGNQWNI